MTEDLQVLPPEAPARPAPAEQLPFTNVRATEKVEIARAATQVMQSFNRADLRPRDERQCFDRIMQLCDNVYFASDALYAVPRGSKKAEGLSVKAATEFARIWGNLDCGYVEHGRYDGSSQFEAYCYDLESNYRFRNAFSVAHERAVGDGKGGTIINKVFKPQEIDELCKARSSKEVRNAILKVLPHYIQEEAEKACKRTMFREAKDIPSSWSACVERFKVLGVNESSLFRYVNKERGKSNALEQITAADIVDLREAYAAIKEDTSSLDDYFPERDKTKVKIDKPPAEKETKSSAQKQKSADTPATTAEPSVSNSPKEAAQTAPSSEQKPAASASQEQTQSSSPPAAPAESSEKSEESAPAGTSDTAAEAAEPPATTAASAEAPASGRAQVEDVF